MRALVFKEFAGFFAQKLGGAQRRGAELGCAERRDWPLPPRAVEQNSRNGAATLGDVCTYIVLIRVYLSLNHALAFIRFFEGWGIFERTMRDRDSERDRYQQLFERSADASLIIEGETFVECNAAAVAMLRCSSREEVLQTHPSELSPQKQADGRDSFEKANEMMALAKAKGSHRFEWQHKRLDGEVFPAEVLLTVIDEGDTSIIHVVWRDLSERWSLEEELRQSQKMQAIGKLAGGIAHDFNNLLVAIFGNCSLLERVNDGPVTLQSIGEIREASERAAALVEQLMAFSRTQPPASEVIGLGRSLDAIAPLLRRIIGEDIRLEVAWAQEVYVRINPSQFDQVLLNLASNARDAMPEGGTLEISLTRDRVAPGELPMGDFARLRVRDSGVGMDAECQRRAFDPFYTSKPLGSGTGFGLSTVYGIIKQCGGHSSLTSKVDEGTTVNLFVPVSEDKIETTTKPVSQGTAYGGDERILVVEDEPTILSLVERNLKEFGYQVTIARNGREGLALAVGQDPGAFDLIVTDVRMPEMSGAAMIEQLHAEGHEPKVLFMSGYAAEELTTLGDDEVDLLRKPFTPEQLAARVRAALDR